MSVEAVKILLGEIVGVGPIGVCPAKGLVTVFGEVQGTEFNGVVEEGVVRGGAVVAEGVVEVKEDGLDVFIGGIGEDGGWLHDEVMRITREGGLCKDPRQGGMVCLGGIVVL